VRGKARTFEVDLEWEAEVATDPMWPTVYRAAWPDVVGCQRENELDHQLRGIDRRVTRGDVELLVDEKYDRHTTGNFFLEHTSAKETGSPGWILGHLDCHYIGYLFTEWRRFYLIPYPLLVQVWEDSRNGWTSAFGDREVLNRPKRGRPYTTVGVAVPIHLVLYEMPGVILVARGERLWMRRPV
jgi:hypothetical protein